MEGVSFTRVPTLIFSREAWERLQAFLTISKKEVSGFGRVRAESGQSYVVDKIYLPQQVVSAGDTEINPESMSDFLMQLIEDGEDPGSVKLWWHSHVNMGLFWSGTDDHNMREITPEGSFMFGLVGVKSGDVRVRLDHSAPDLTIDHIPVVIDYVSPETTRLCIAEMGQMVRERVPIVRSISSSDGQIPPDKVGGGSNAGSRRGRRRSKAATPVGD